ncbi:carboxypeptidase-like regulatory domain-containing protein [Micromonospora haikouensis]|uniref:carboxypeptidase-like regulatory domain-containing protein n=1 Tax=Micromonospora haikouensis TaxID=686309 RepID=UPI003D73390B
MLVGAVVLAGAPPAFATETGTIVGRLTTSSGAAATNIPLVVYPSGEYEHVASAQTDSTGDWTVTGLAPGRYTVMFYADGIEQYYRQTTELREADDVIVTAGETARADDQILPTGFLTGQITDTSGQPVSDLGVNASEADGSQWGAGRTDEDGRYRIRVRPGTYHLRFEPVEGSFQKQYVPGKLDREDAGRFEVTADADTVVDETVLPTGSLSGRFTTTSGTPLTSADVSVTTVNGYNGINARTDATGTFTIPTLLAGSYKVRFRKGSREQHYRGKLDLESADAVVVRGGEQTSIEDSLLGTGSVRISAVNSVTGARVTNFCAHAAYNDYQEVCSYNGQVTLTGVPQGRHDIFLYAPDKSYFSQDLLGVEVVANQTTVLSPKLLPKAVVTTTPTGQGMRPAGSPVPTTGTLPVKLVVPTS